MSPIGGRLALVKLPEAATVTTQICSNDGSACIEVAVPDGAKQHAGNAETRVGLHAHDRSYVQFFVGPGPGVATNVSIEYSVHLPKFPESFGSLFVSPGCR